MKIKHIFTILVAMIGLMGVGYYDHTQYYWKLNIVYFIAWLYCGVVVLCTLINHWDKKINP